VIEAIFATLTNVNFDEDSVAELVSKAVAVRNQARKLYLNAAAKAGVAAEALSDLPPSSPPRSGSRCSNRAAIS